MRGSLSTERGRHGLSPQNAFPDQPCHSRHHRIAQHSQALWSMGNPRIASEHRGLAYPLLTFFK